MWSFCVCNFQKPFKQYIIQSWIPDTTTVGWLNQHDKAHKKCCTLMYYNSYDTTFYYLFTTIYCILTAIYCCYYFLLQFTIFYCKLPHFYRKLPHRWSKFFKKKFTKNYYNLLQFYCNLQQQFTAFSCTAIVFFVVSTSKYRLFSTSIYYNLLHSYCNLLLLLFFTAVYCKLPRFTAIYRPSGTTVWINPALGPGYYTRVRRFCQLK